MSPAGEPIYPKRIRSFSDLPFKTVAQRDLPSNVPFLVSQGAESNEDPDYHGRVCYTDLNEDGVKELIVQSESKTARIYDIWQKRKGSWVNILQISGLAYLVAKQNSFYQIETQEGDRQGNEVRELYRFSEQRYHLIRADDYKDEAYVGTRDVREREEALERNYREQFKNP